MVHFLINAFRSYILDILPVGLLANALHHIKHQPTSTLSIIDGYIELRVCIHEFHGLRRSILSDATDSIYALLFIPGQPFSVEDDSISGGRERHTRC